MGRVSAILFPFHKYHYEFACDESCFVEKLEAFRKEYLVNYTAGKHYINHDHKEKNFSFNRRILNPGSGSGGLFKYKYKVHNNRLFIECRMGYSLLLYFLFMFLCMGTFMFAYIPFNLFFQMEAFIIKEDFENYFNKEILRKSYNSMYRV